VAVIGMSHEPPVLEKFKESIRLARAGLDRFEKKGDPTDKEVLLRIYCEVSVFVEEMESRLGLTPDSDLD